MILKSFWLIVYVLIRYIYIIPQKRVVVNAKSVQLKTLLEEYFPNPRTDSVSSQYYPVFLRSAVYWHLYIREDCRKRLPPDLLLPIFAGRSVHIVRRPLTANVVRLFATELLPDFDQSNPAACFWAWQWRESQLQEHFRQHSKMFRNTKLIGNGGLFAFIPTDDMCLSVWQQSLDCFSPL